MLVFKHPKYYEEMRKRARAYQKELKASQEKKAISPNQSTDRGGRAPTVESYKRQASSNKHRSGSESVRILVNHWRWLETQGPSYKRQAASCKLQAISQVKRQAASD